MIIRKLIEKFTRHQYSTKLSKSETKCYSGEPGSCSSTGAVYSRPLTTSLGLVKATCVVVSSIYTGAWISRNGAEFLEENEIFVPEDE
ncbi:hypothetical protein MN116_007272 [Schistosoma mekongi]|uniref:Essential MCU regulator, mitochondrial n=1 Tax=Schistosoma mekongi TaxID=38744 RepID=A0AAE2D399_SCHME|nr:hypothetical protein MN116_007272 [Schistosoma mekongi]